MSFHRLQYKLNLNAVAASILILKGHLGLPWEDYQQAVIDEFLCMVASCTLGTDVCHWMFKKTVNMDQGQQDGLLNLLVSHMHFQNVLCFFTTHT